jgi:hypothetical protein
VSSLETAPPLGSPARPKQGDTELLLKTSRERSLCSIRSAPNPYLVAMFLKGGEVHVCCDVLATEVIEDLLPRGVLPPAREVAAQIPVELPSAKSAIVPKNRSRSTATCCSRGRDVGRPGRNGSSRARGCGFNRHVTPGEDGLGHFAVARLTRPRSHPTGTPSAPEPSGVRRPRARPRSGWICLAVTAELTKCWCGRR